MKDYYQILGINRNSTEEEIKQAFRNLAKTHHPDKGGNKEKFQELQEAYDTLTDPNKKQVYDNPLPQFNNIFQQGFPFNFNNIFKNQYIKKSDHHHTYTVKLKDVYTGFKKTFILKRTFNCKNCYKTCLKCNGNGFLPQHVYIGPITHTYNQPCYSCNSTGKFNNNNSLEQCQLCNNTGNIDEEKTIEINIPKAVEKGFKFVYDGWGEQAVKNDEKSGDLIIIINVEDDNNFTRKGLDLYYNYNITFKESIIGKKITIPYFHEPFDIDIKSFGIINPDKNYIVFQKGLENDKGNKGSLYVKFNIEYPVNRILNDTEINILNNTLSSIKID
jgi:DnaJ family protein A protein 2